MSSPDPAGGAPTARHTHDGGDHCPGASRAFAAEDGRVARVRLAGAPLTPHQARGVADLAERLGDATVWLTTRSNVQVRGLDDAGVEAFARGIEALGLLPSATHDRARNVVVSPFAGDDVLALARAIDLALCERPGLAGLSGRFLVGLDDGTGELLAFPLDLAVQVHGERLRLRLGSDPRSYDLGPLDDPDGAADHVTDTLQEFLRLAGDEDVWNVDDLSDDARDDLHACLEDTLPLAPSLVTHRRLPRLAGRHRGLGRSWLAATAPLARVPVAGWRALADVADEQGSDVRVTPWHAVVVEAPDDLTDDDAQAALARLAATGWVVSPGSAWIDVHGCSGIRHCRRSRSDVQAHARDLVAAVDGTAPLERPVMIVGCERRCGHPSVDHYAVVASGAEVYTVAEHDGTHAPQPRPTTTATPATLARIVAQGHPRGDE